MAFLIQNGIIQIISDKEADDAIKAAAFLNHEISLDIETAGLNEMSDILLVGLGTNDIQVVYTEFPLELMKYLYSCATIIAHNAKFDLSLIYWQYNILPNVCYCTMIADRRLYQGFGPCESNPFPIRFDLVSVVKRHLKKERATGKDTRLDFINKKKAEFTPTEEQILYLAEDIRDLELIKESQMELINKRQLELLILEIENPLVLTLIRMEREGLVLDKEAWLKLYDENCKIKDKAEYEMDQLILAKAKELGKMQLFSGYNLHLKRESEVKILNTDFFGNEMDPKLAFKIPKSRKIQYNGSRLNYNSPKDLLLIFSAFDWEVPTTDQNALIPYMDTEFKLYSNYGIDNQNGIKSPPLATKGFTFGIPILKEYYMANPDYAAIPFIKLLESYSEASTKISNYGHNYVDKINKHTGKIHTTYRQAHAVTGRLQSGGGSQQKDKFNSQNVPRSNKYRNCFSAGPDYSIFTCDLTGAEAVIIADKSNDSNLIKFALEDDDVHSPIAQYSWRNIYLYRAGYDLYWRTTEEFWGTKNTVNDIKFYSGSREKNFLLSKDLIITKKHNKHLRDSFKSCTFGAIYGMYAAKAGKVLNIPKDEGQIVIDSIKLMMPDAFRLMETNIAQVLGKRNKNKQYYQNPIGYIPLNPRTRSTLFFPEVIKHIKSKGAYEIDFFNYHKIEGNVRNAPIQGTQADMLKEAMVVIDNYFKTHKLDCALILQVHDELVGRCPKNMDGISEEWKSDPHPVLFADEPVSIPVFVKKVMEYVANKYLTNVKMTCSYDVANYWIK